MRKSSEINDKVMIDLWSNLKEGKTEKYYGNLLKEMYESYGVNKFSLIQ